MGYKSPHCYTLNLHATMLAAPSDAATYYFGGYITAPTTTPANHRTLIPKDGRITRVQVTAFCIVGGNEAVEMDLRLNAATDTVISTTGDMSASNVQWVNNNLDIPVTTADYIMIKMICPTWAVLNPTNVFLNANVFIETE